jgi:hypothetical protein
LLVLHANRARSAVIGLLVFAVVSWLTAAPAGAMSGHKAITGAGHLSCTLTGGVAHFSPPWKSPSTPDRGHGRVHLSRVMFSSCTDATGDAVHVTGGSMLGGHGSVPTTSCSAFTSSGAMAVNIVARLKWATDGTTKLRTSVIQLTTAQFALGGTNVFGTILDLTADGTVTGGSFAGNSLHVSIVVDSPLESLMSVCGTRTGLGGFGFNDIQGPSIGTI